MSADLPSRIAAAVGHGLWYAQSAPDSVQPEATKAVLAVVQLIAADRDRLAGELEEAAHRTNVQRTRAELAEAERDQLRTGMEDLFTRWFLNAHAGLGYREAMVGIAADLRNVLANADVHVCKPDASLYYCPTAAEIESSCHGGFDTCCSAAELHRPAVTNHTYEGEAGLAQTCQAEAFGETCGAAWEQHQMREEPSP